MIKPEPVHTSTVCSVCGQPWASHGEKPTVMDCVRVLKAALVTAKRTHPIYVTGGTSTYPYTGTTWAIGQNLC